MHNMNVVIPCDRSFCYVFLRSYSLHVSHPLHLFVASTSIPYVYFIHFVICFGEDGVRQHCYCSSIEMKNGWTHQQRLRLLFIIAECRQICHTFHYSSTWFLFSFAHRYLRHTCSRAIRASESTPFVCCNSAAKICNFGYIASWNVYGWLRVYLEWILTT